MLSYVELVFVIHCVLLSQWLWIMVCYAEPVVVNRGVLFWAIGCESWCAMLNQWLCIMVCYAEACGCESWCVILRQWLWIMVCYAEPGVVNHSELWWASCLQSWCVMLSQWIMHYGVLWSNQWLCIWCAMLSQWLWIMVSYAEPVVMNHGVLYAGGLCSNQWLWIIVFAMLSHGCESWCVMLNQWLWIMVCYAEPVVVYYGVLCRASGCESWFVYAETSGCES